MRTRGYAAYLMRAFFHLTFPRKERATAAERVLLRRKVEEEQARTVAVSLGRTEEKKNNKRILKCPSTSTSARVALSLSLSVALSSALGQARGCESKSNPPNSVRSGGNGLSLPPPFFFFPSLRTETLA